MSTLYVSEHAPKMVSSLSKAMVSGRQACLLSTFLDKPYNRSSISVSGEPKAVVAAMVAGVRTVRDSGLDFSKHKGLHPALGSVDHVSVHPLRPGGDRAAAVQTARGIASELGRDLKIPVFTYGWAHAKGTSLASQRRGLGYFSTHVQEGGQGRQFSIPDTVSPCFGPSTPHPHMGVAMVGAVPPVVNFNIQVDAKDVKQAKRLANRVRSAKNDKLHGVEAMGLSHGECFEVACNLLATTEPGGSGPSDVEQALRAACEENGVKMGRSYVIGMLPSDALAKTVEALGLDELVGSTVTGGGSGAASSS